jgi:hypothetical protein
MLEISRSLSLSGPHNPRVTSGFDLGQRELSQDLALISEYLSAGAAAGGILPATHEAQAALAFVEPAIARADIALDTPIFEPVPAASNAF